MNLKILSFISISFHSFFLNQDKSIEGFWKDDKNINFGYYDTAGNIYKIENNTKTSKLLYNNINYLNNFKYVDDYHILNFNNDKNENSCIIKKNYIKTLKWDDSTLHESIYNNNYFRINYFGDVYIKNLIDKSSTKININFDEINYYQKITNYNEYIFAVDDRNQLFIYDLKNKFLEKLSYQLKEKSCIKKMIVKKLGTYYNISILYTNNKIDIITISYIEHSKSFIFYNRNIIDTNVKVIDFEIKSTLVIVCSEKKIFFYKFNPFAVSVQKLIDKNLSIPYYTNILCLDKFLLFNNFNFIPYILVNYND